MRQLWQYTHPQSLTYGFMQDPLLSEEVLLAWDHVARLKTALDQRPDDLVAFPVPKGPKGRAYMPVIVGMAIPKNAPNPAGGKALMQHMLRISAQAQILSIDRILPGRRAATCRRASHPGCARKRPPSRRQQKAKDAVQALLPIGIGAEGGNFNKIYIDTFTRIVRNGENIQTVLNEQGALLQADLRQDGRALLGTRPAERKGSLQGEVENTASFDIGRRRVTSIASRRPRSRAERDGGRVCCPTG